jgi:catechol 2,3-dioxygenase-like lactoylglutathione lyase family enzyme
MTLDHLILSVNDADESARFYAEVLGLASEHLAFAMTRAEFEEVFRRVRAAAVRRSTFSIRTSTYRNPAL